MDMIVFQRALTREKQMAIRQGRGDGGRQGGRMNHWITWQRGKRGEKKQNAMTVLNII